MNDKISIIIPVYNVEEYLKTCIDSVINQTYKNLEIICVNDCSPDNSLAILKQYEAQDERIRIVNHKVNKGLAEARNSGMDVATGKYIFFLDSDDYIVPDIIEKLYAKIIRDNADAVYSKTQVFTDSSEPELIDRANKKQYVYDQLPSEDILFSIENNNLCTILHSGVEVWGKLFSVDFLKKHNIFFIKKNIKYEDSDFTIKFLSHFPKLSTLPEVGVMYRTRHNQITEQPLVIKDLKIAVYNALQYCKQNHNKETYNFIRTSLNNNSTHYARVFMIDHGFWFKYKWRKNDKHISLLGIIFFSEKIKNGFRITSILGIHIRKEKIM